MQYHSPADVNSNAQRLELPTRIRSSADTGADIAIRVTLADRIANLPGIFALESEDVLHPRNVSVMLRLEGSTPRHPVVDTLLCEISPDGIQVCGLSRWDQNQVVRHGWGRFNKRDVQLRMPRNEREIDICVTIIEQAHKTLSQNAMVSSQRAATFWKLPQYSRTSLH